MIYVGTGPERGKVVDEDDALDFALARCGVTISNPDAPDADEFRRMMVDWYYSGNWKQVGA